MGGLLKNAWFVSAVAYGACFPAMIALHRMLPQYHADLVEDPIAFAAAADVLATVVIFVFSVLFNNSSVYDPYWSVAPAVMVVYWLAHPAASAANAARGWLVAAFVMVWAVRLTWNCMRKWHSMDHEDWRYADIRQQWGGGIIYWLISFFGFHLMPTILVMLGCIPVGVAILHGTAPLNGLDAAAAVVGIVAIGLETFADEQMRSYQLSRRSADTAGEPVCDRGLWGWSRHPNYVGEALFWWSMFLFSLACADRKWAAINVWGALLITLLLRFISTRLMDVRSAKRRGKAWADYAARVPVFLGGCGSKRKAV